MKRNILRLKRKIKKCIIEIVRQDSEEKDFYRNYSKYSKTYRGRTY